VVATAQPKIRVRDRENKTKQLVYAAISVFAERGYEKATTREISERAGCAEGLIYKYFGGKRQLLFAALESRGDSKLDDQPGNGTLEDEIRGLLQRRIDRAWQDRDFMKVCISLASVDADLAQIMDSLGRDNVIRTSAYLTGLIEAGLLNPDTDVEAAANIFGGVMLGLGYFGRIVFARDKETIDAQVAAVARQLCRGFAPA
jgi:TetR/AcrR family transcriptional regulator, regulator of cefoperazone and chloramphenicol sensitivity